MSLYNHRPALIRAALDDQPGSWDALLDSWRPVILRWARRMGGPRIEAEDVLQDVSVAIWTHLRTVRAPEKTFPAWVYRVTQREIMRRRRRAWMRRVLLMDTPIERVDTGPTAEDRVALSEDARLVQAALERLPPKQREVLVLYEMEGLNQREMSELLEVKLGTVKSRMRLARQRFELEVRAMRPPQPPAENRPAAKPSAEGREHVSSLRRGLGDELWTDLPAMRAGL